MQGENSASEGVIQAHDEINALTPQAPAQTAD